ncbi:MAG: methylated-DNA--[protein]-cysteine S-methyltransferase [Campylobacterota bacterium]|nr:methylated-DNA--[protein]-cysteine S-methyltransferase [Campylobacterota bacterium]
MNQINIQYYKTKHAEFILGSYDGKLCMLDFRYRKKRTTVDSRIKKVLNAEFIEKDDGVLKETRKQLDEYFKMKRKEFDVPLLMVGTAFQKSVWSALLEVPYGTTASYLELSKTIGNEKAVRAVANANGANAIGIIIPCHRIIGSNGELTGYAGGLALKKRLLELENNLFTS